MESKDLKLQNTDNYIPLLNDVLKIISGKVPIIIEIKNDKKVGIIEQEIMNILKTYNGIYAIHSFNPFTIFWLRRNYPNIIRGQLVSNFKNKKINLIKKILLKNMTFNFMTKPDFISYDIKALPNNKLKRNKGKKMILGWTIKNKEQMEKARKYCDNYICENIEEIINS